MSLGAYELTALELLSQLQELGEGKMRSYYIILLINQENMNTDFVSSYIIKDINIVKRIGLRALKGQKTYPIRFSTAIPRELHDPVAMKVNEETDYTIEWIKDDLIRVHIIINKRLCL